MTLKNLQNYFLEELKALYPKEETLTFFRILAAHRLGLSRVAIALKADFRPKQADLDFFLSAFAELQQEKPIQYILGETEFYGLPFKVTKDVLIPRPETEELVQWILDEIKEKREHKVKSEKESTKFQASKPKTQNPKPEAQSSEPRTQNSKLKILDIGTGSGCIAISLAKYLPNAEIYALDVSENALNIAKQNAALNEVKINFIQQDILQPDVMLSLSKLLLDGQKFDIIVSNPPYVRDLEKHEIKQNVLANEPHLALFVKNENPLLFYDKIAEVAKEQLTGSGFLFFEINQYLCKETVALLKEKGFQDIELRKDLFGNDRMTRTNL